MSFYRYCQRYEEEKERRGSLSFSGRLTFKLYRTLSQMGNHYRVFIVLQFADKSQMLLDTVVVVAFNVATFAVKIF